MKTSTTHKKMVVRWRNIPPLLGFTPLMMIPTEETWVECEESDWAIALELSTMFDWINPDHIRIESKQIMNP